MTDIALLVEAVEHGAVEKVRAILDAHPDLVNERDETGATALHSAAFGGNRPIVHLLIERGAEINALDSCFGATPAGWAIEYLRELGGFLGIELADFGFAIRRGDVEWARRFVDRFPGLRTARDAQGIPFKQLADESGNAEIVRLFE
jgi:ankyrin repeat protein